MSPYIFLKIIAEAVLSFFPVVNRFSSLAPFVISLLRIIVIAGIFLIIAIFRGTIVSLLQNHIFSLTWIAMGLINIAHIWSSNEGFRYMPMGPALGIFYLYPIIAVVLAWGFLGRKVSLWSWVGLAIAFSGVLWMNLAGNSSQSCQGSLDCSTEAEAEADSLQVSPFGTLMMVISATTEALLYTFVISGGKVFDSPFNSTFATHLWGAVPAIGMLLLELQKQKPPGLSNEMISVGAINGVIGAVGMGLTYLSARHITPGMYALLTYVSIVFGFGYGSLFFSDVIQVKDLVGIALILFGNYLGGAGEMV